jgi:hypothetical protein
LTPDVKRVTPRLVYEGSNAINYVYLRSVGIMLGQNLVRDYTDSAIVELGKRLVEPGGGGGGGGGVALLTTTSWLLSSVCFRLDHRKRHSRVSARLDRVFRMYLRIAVEYRKEEAV